MCFTSNDFVTGLTISLWTIVQTSFHIIWGLYGYYSYICKIHPSNYWLVIVYLTYFYNHECGDINIEGDLFTVKKTKKHFEDEDNVYNIVNTIVKNATLPLQSPEANRTLTYIVIYILVDGFWIVSAFLLSAGTYFRIKKCPSLFFYGPWILTTGVTILLDTVSSVHFGLDLLQIHSYTAWLKFIGVSNYKDFSKFNNYDSSRYVPQGSSTLMCSLFSRFFIFWIVNIICLFRITNIAILAFREDPSITSANNRKGMRSRYSKNPPGVDTNSTDARIRNWQLFYGTVETSTMSSSSSKSSDRAYHNNSNTGGDRHSARTASITPVAQSSHNLEGSLEMGNITPIQEFSEILNNASSHYTKFSDVAEDIHAINSRKGSMGSLHDHLPWKYTRSPRGQSHSEMGENSRLRKVKNTKNDRFTTDDAGNKTMISTAL